MAWIATVGVGWVEGVTVTGHDKTSNIATLLTLLLPAWSSHNSYFLFEASRDVKATGYLVVPGLVCLVELSQQRCVRLTKPESDQLLGLGASLVKQNVLGHEWVPAVAEE
ncbi:hypothetical protein RRG08_049187 [Elysia crispata]|uniref:Uncharacterized protein n=1 Tax=Elysia crispata TaxID=231223 RepID=A0AAE1ARA7_9GAST|nr:hypothetical protein RRG08_049187 [Elysia crispata]